MFDRSSRGRGSRGRFVWMALLAAVIFPASLLLAQASSPGDAGGGAGEGRPMLELTSGLPTLVELYNTSPYINTAIAALSVIGVVLFLYFLFTIKTGSLAPATLVDDLTKLVLAGRFDEVATVCRARHGVFIASIVQRCAENAGKEHSVIMDMIDAEGRRRADIIWNRISYLADVSNVAPMLGLLGTVVGMINAFFMLPSQSTSINSRLLAHGIGGALSTTMFGLIVAIATLVFYSIVKARVTRSLAEVEQVVHSIADHIKRGGK